MDTITGYKDRALESLKGFWDKGILATLIFFVIIEGVGCGFSLIFPNTGGAVFNWLWFFLCVPLVWGFNVYFFRLNHRENVDLARLFDGYHDWKRIFTTELLVFLYTFLWSLLFIVPGIIKAYSYALTPYVLNSYPELSNNAAIELSMKLMQRKKMKLFLLQLSFIGWGFLCLLTMGLGFLLLIPYMQSAQAHFYQDATEVQVYIDKALAREAALKAEKEKENEKNNQ